MAGICHTRLAVIDVNDRSKQPMTSICGEYMIVFNGEIYNHIELRKKLKNYICKTQSDTETLLESIELLGIKNTLQKTVGMFAFVVWDKKNRTLTLVRDRMGEKPLYYGWISSHKKQFVHYMITSHNRQAELLQWRQEILSNL